MLCPKNDEKMNSDSEELIILWLLAKENEMWLFIYCSAITNSILSEFFCNFIFSINNIADLVWLCLELFFFIMYMRQSSLATVIMGTIVYRHNRVWAQSCMGTIVCGYNHVWAHECVGTNVYRHKRVWAQSCADICVWAQSCGSIKKYLTKKTMANESKSSNIFHPRCTRA